MLQQIVTRRALPSVRDRLPLGVSGLKVSPICLGLVGSPDIVPAAYDAGINFFFLTADLHWPLYDGLRKGLRDLLARGGSVRDDIVVGVVSYLDQPMFQHLQFHEVIDSVPGLQRVDILIAGAVPGPQNFNARYQSILAARSIGHCGARSIGASFHDRPTALAALNENCLDVHFIRYNAAHPGARHDIFPFLRPDRRSLIYNFTSVLAMVTPERFHQLGLNGNYWLPKVTDYYRFVLTQGQINGLLCAPRSVDQLDGLYSALAEGALTPEEEEYMTWLSSIAVPKYF